MAKARELSVDVVILDLEDAVAEGTKASARDLIGNALREGGYGGREILLRINAIDGPHWESDVALALASGSLAGVLVPKVEKPEEITAVSSLINRHDAGSPLRIWAMVETPIGVQRVAEIAAADPRCECLVLGTQDLAKALRIPADRGRLGLLSALSTCVLAARANGLDILDGVLADFRDLDALRSACIQGRCLGFDGKTLIHPAQIAVANEVFGPQPDDLAGARGMIAAWEARESSAGVVQHAGRMIEALHVEQAREMLAFAAAVEALHGHTAAPDRR